MSLKLVKWRGLEACSLAEKSLKIKESDQGRSTREQNSKEKSLKATDFYPLMFVLGGECFSRILVTCM